MHHLLITIGSHGDTHPFIGIGEKLRDRDAEVRDQGVKDRLG